MNRSAMAEILAAASKKKEGYREPVVKQVKVSAEDYAQVQAEKEAQKKKKQRALAIPGEEFDNVGTGGGIGDDVGSSGSLLLAQMQDVLSQVQRERQAFQREKHELLNQVKQQLALQHQRQQEEPSSSSPEGQKQQPDDDDHNKKAALQFRMLEMDHKKLRAEHELLKQAINNNNKNNDNHKEREDSHQDKKTVTILTHKVERLERLVAELEQQQQQQLAALQQQHGEQQQQPLSKRTTATTTASTTNPVKKTTVVASTTIPKKKKEEEEDVNDDSSDDDSSDDDDDDDTKAKQISRHHQQQPTAPSNPSASTTTTTTTTTVVAASSSSNDGEFAFEPFTADTWAKHQGRDPDLKAYLAKSTGLYPKFSMSVKEANGKKIVLFYKKPYVPATLRQHCLEHYHTASNGNDEWTRIICKKVIWPSLDNDITNFKK